MLSDELFQEALQAAKAVNGRLEVMLSRGLRREDYLKLPPQVREKIKPPAWDDGVNVTIYDPAALPRRIRIEDAAQESMLIARIAPVDPRQPDAGARGTDAVKLSIVVGKDGTVIDAAAVAGPELLIGAAVDAVKQWTYRPTLLNGIPVEVQAGVEVRFASAG